ncbi:hypothetical protein M422DRAFT_252810 [Sphaerobolus stellatus SS14]|uniref:Uncharacterized protein n=1 Tax=Sphaerobolus stellatus (strain SS14) TaxID=990650 RepID=A0A0C9VAA6_SPHS4|nr:hypothetical protein M422DRAFT_252810 [Sphaerobolus stellatus SS14]
MLIRVIYVYLGFPFTHATNGKKVACDQCVHHKTNCTYWSLQDLIVQKKLKSIGKSVTSIDANSEVQNCLQAKSFYHQYNLQTLENQLPSDSSVPEELQDAVEHGRLHVVEQLGKGFRGWVPLLNPYGELDLPGEVESRTKRGREEEVVAGSGPSKRVRIEKVPESKVEEVEKEVGPDPTPVVERGKGKEKEAEPEENGKDTMKE